MSVLPEQPLSTVTHTCEVIQPHGCTYRRTQTHLTTTRAKPTRPPAKHAQRLGFSYKPRCVRCPALARGAPACCLRLAQWRASHKATPHSRLFSHSILTARGSISGRKLRQRSQKLKMLCLTLSVTGLFYPSKRAQQPSSSTFDWV